jgi:type I restriction enzyme R subunit
MTTEADTCRTYVVPKLHAAGWEDEQIREQVTFTDGRIVPIGGKATRKKQKRADYILRYRRDFPIAVIEAKASYRHPADGLPQAKAYAQALGLKFAYATNGRAIIEFDYLTGATNELELFPSPKELWRRLDGSDEPDKTDEILLAPGRTPKTLRYYQDIAINQAIAGILEGKNRLLLTLATGTGKTLIAAQIAYKLWNMRWTRKGIGGRRPKILFLADRNFLVDDPYSKDFAIFGEARHKIQRVVNTSRDMFFAIYQAVDDREWTPGLYRQYPPDFFDLIVVDECHRGSADPEGNWREILNFFHSAVQLGMTATPLRDDNRDTYAYFGNPLYLYSLKQGIEDGFLAPYRVHRVATNLDLDGYRPAPGQLDRDGKAIPDKRYTTPAFEREVALKPRTRALARHLTDFLIKRGDRFAKTIVFCVDQEHAAEMMVQLQRLNQDLMKEHPDYIVRITSADGDEGRGYLSRFSDVESKTPAIVTTSQLLTTGVDIPTCRVIAIARTVNSMTEFKQIIGRGTRVRDDYGKLWFEIIDYTGSAVARFADPEFDGDPALTTQEEIDAAGQVLPGSQQILQPEEREEGELATGETSAQPLDLDDPKYARNKFHVDRGFVEVVANLVYELDPDGNRLRVVSYAEYSAETIQRMVTNPIELRTKWTNAEQRAAVIAALEERGVSLERLVDWSGDPGVDPFDLLCNIAFQAPLRTRRERSDQLKREQQKFFQKFSPEARQILNEILDKYVEFGLTQFKMPEILKIPPILQHGNPLEISRVFGGEKQLRSALSQMQAMLYAA